jgi:4-amino-4-deoxy-L-arabinose transferase-like glycosyltransferase
VFAVGPVLAVAAIKLALQLSVLTRYGWHRDEFYYLVGGRHLDAGYVDHPLLVPWTARAVEAIAGPSLAGLRVVPALLGVATVVLGALITRELGGGRVAQVLAALCVALDPVFLAMNHWFQTPSFDIVAWVAVAFFVIRLLRTGDERWWLAVGGAAAFGLLAKTTIVVWLAALVVGLLLTPARRHLRSRWFLGAVGLALLGALPFLWYQIRHDWAFVEFSRNMNARTGGEEQPLFVPGQLLMHNPVTALVWIPGLVALFRDRDLRWCRPLGWAYVVAFAAFLASAGKAYYLAPVYPVLFAAGATYLARRRDWTRLPKLLVAGIAVGTILALPGSLPVLPLRDVADTPYAEINEDILEQVGWPELVATVERVVHERPGPTVVLTGNYGEAGALDVLGDVGAPVWSGQNSYWSWGGRPAPAPGTTFVVLGVDRGFLGRSFARCDLAAHVDNRLDVDNDEQGGAVMACRGLRRPWSEVWSDLRTFQ